MKNSESIPSSVAQAAVNASAAANGAAQAAAKAADNATIAAKAASDSATAIAIVATDTSWMKKSLESIETKLNEMDKQFVTTSQHSDVIKELGEHETRLNTLETNNTKNTTLLVIGSGILTFLVGLLIWHLFQS